MIDAWAGTLSWWSYQSSVVHSCGLLNYPHSFCGGMFKLNVKFDADLLLYLLSHFECTGHTVHMLTQWHLLPLLTSTVKSLFTHAHSSPFSLTSRLHQCHIKCSRYIDNGWTFSGQSLCLCMCVCVCMLTAGHFEILFSRRVHHTFILGLNK